jgi:hypothetical protein
MYTVALVFSWELNEPVKSLVKLKIEFAKVAHIQGYLASTVLLAEEVCCF